MKIFYSLIFLVFLAVLILFTGSFFYFAEVVHEKSQFNIRSGGKTIGQIFIDRYSTEENIVIKSKKVSFEKEYLPVSTIKYVISKKYADTYEIENAISLSGRSDTVKIKQDENNFQFVNKLASKFAFYSDSTSVDNVLPYNRYECSTWLPFLNKYHFALGGQQTFKAVVLDNALLPPYQTEISFLNIGAEYLSIENRKIRTEKIVFTQADIDGKITIWYVPKLHKIYKVFYDKEDIALDYFKSNEPDELLGETVSEQHFPTANTSIQDIVFFSGNKKINGSFSRP
ncbi:MAG: hypothetical protein PHQ52_04190, partial [Candidatus Omnitrophica bacterium]|nr:hypothetical protein [Candidatus Omnitrophota bacterium]